MGSNKKKESWKNISDVKNNILKINSITPNNEIWNDLASQNERQTFYSDNNDTEIFFHPLIYAAFLMKIGFLLKHI